MKCGGASQLISEKRGIYDFYGIYQYCCFNIWLWNPNNSIWMPTSLSLSLLQLVPTASPGVFHAYLGVNRHALLLWRCSKGARELENACSAITRPWVWFPGHIKLAVMVWSGNPALGDAERHDSLRLTKQPTSPLGIFWWEIWPQQAKWIAYKEKWHLILSSGPHRYVQTSLHIAYVYSYTWTWIHTCNQLPL